MKTKKPHPENKVMWAYFAPDGYIQVRSIADTKKLSKLMIPKGCSEDVTWKDYERAGYRLHKIQFTVSIMTQ